MSGVYFIYFIGVEGEAGYRRIAYGRWRAELAAFLVGLQTWWPNPLNARRVTITRVGPKQ